MPRTITDQELRGVIAQILRRNLDPSGAWLVNKYLREEYPNIYNNVAAGQLNNLISVLKNSVFPEPVQVPYSFEYWYNYFYKEVPREGNQGGQRLHFMQYVVNDDGSFRNENDRPFPKSWRSVFDEMLNKGFIAFSAADHISAQQAMEHAGATHELQHKWVSVAFRGDSRLPAKIQGDHGTARQSQVTTLRGQRHMDRPWHPFSDQGHKVWVRREHTDNCLFSAVSITPEFEVATKFPLISGLQAENPGAIGKAIVRVRVAGPPAPQGGVAARYLAAVQQANSIFETRRLLATKTNVYCVRLRDVYNTQNYQGQGPNVPFPEYAATRISWTDHLLWFSVIRIHFGQNENDGHLIVITDHRWLQDQNLISSVLLNAVGLTLLRSFVTDVVHRGSLVAGRGGIVHMPAGGQPPFNIESVEDPFIP